MVVVNNHNELKNTEKTEKCDRDEKCVKTLNAGGFYDSISTVITKTVEEITKVSGQKNPSVEVSIGIPDFALQKGNLVILGSRPSIGKSSFACSVIRKLGVYEKRPVGMITTGPMDYSHIGKRLLSIETRIPYFKIMSGFINNDEAEHIQRSAGVICSSPIFLHDAPNGSFAEIECAIRCMVQEKKVEMVFIDSYEYLDEIVNPEKYDEFYTKIDLLEDYKKLAGELKIPIVILMEIPEAENGSEPGINDFRKDMMIPRTADMVIFLERNRGREECSEIPSKLIVAKNENGRTRDYPIMFRERTGEFVLGEKK